MTYDIAILGSGPGGYVAALYASRHKLRICIIEQGDIGGTCLNRGCIPTKSLLTSAAILSTVRNSAAFGINSENCRIDFKKIMSRKDQVVTRLRAGVETLFRANSIDLIRGRARLAGPQEIHVEGSGIIRAENIIVATGSRASNLQGITIDERDILSSDGIVSVTSLPESITIVGGGVIGCEFAHLFSVLGSKVTIVELTERLIPGQSREVSKKLERIFSQRGIDIRLSTRVTAIQKDRSLTLTLSKDPKITTDKVLIAVGRTPNTAELGLKQLGIETANDRITVNDHLRTACETVFAIGDCVAGPQLAHKASYDGILACDAILGNPRRVDYSAIPCCIWTDPQISSVGLTEEDARARFSDARIAKFPYLASGKAYLEGKTEGFIKIVGSQAGDIHGVEIMGEGACELISEAVLAKTMHINIKDWKRAVHGHPTISEITQEAIYSFCGTPIHSI